MRLTRFLLLAFIISFSGCNNASETVLDIIETTKESSLKIPNQTRGALLLKDYKSFKDFKKVVKIEYEKGRRPLVRLTHQIHGKSVTSELKSGVSEQDFMNAKDKGFWDKVWIVFNSPYGVWHRNDFRKIYALSRRRQQVFGEGDPAFYDLAETMMQNISEEDKATMPPEFLTEKGYLNTFNHITSQAFLTSVFSEKMADFLADIHERKNMPELVTGIFTAAQIADMEKGPTDNYLDIINNEWGQELGKKLGRKYRINKSTNWSPELLANYLNDIQNYYSGAFQIGFRPFKSSDILVIQFSKKINLVMGETPIVR